MSNYGLTVSPKLVDRNTADDAKRRLATATDAGARAMSTGQGDPRPFEKTR